MQINIQSSAFFNAKKLLKMSKQSQAAFFKINKIHFKYPKKFSSGQN